MTDAPLADRPNQAIALLPRPRRRHRRRDQPQPRRWRARPAALPRLPDRRPRRARHLPRGRQPAVDRRVGSRASTADRPRSRRPCMTVLRALPTTTKPMDALRTAVSAWGTTQDLPWPPTIEQARALTVVLAVRAGGVRPAAGRQGADRAGPVARPGRGVPVPAQRASGRTPARARALDAYFIVGAEHGFNASTFTARVVTSTRSDIASAVDRGDRDDEGAAPRRRPVRGRRPAQPGRLGRARRGMGPRRARPRRAADGLRPSRLPRLRPAGRGAAQGRRGDGATAPSGSSSRSRSRTSSSASSPRSTPSGRSRPTSSSTPRPS